MKPEHERRRGGLDSDPDRADLSPAFKQAELFQGLSEQQLASVAARFKRATYDQDEIILLQGAPAEAFYLVGEGKVKVVQTSVEGLEVLLHVFEPGGVIGALPTVGEDTYPATAITLEPATIFYIMADDFDQLLLEHPRVGRNLLKFATRMLQSAHQRLREMATERVERRIARTLARLVRQLGEEREGEIKIDAPLSRQDLADMSGTTLYTVSRTLKSWERQGLLRAGRKQLTILRPHDLITIAEDLPDPSQQA